MTSETTTPTTISPGSPGTRIAAIETVTYLLSGTVEHGDSLGNRGALGAGDVQWMTAGRGILHQEMPRGDPRGRMHGFQLWAKPARVEEDDRAALPGRRGRTRSRSSSTTTAPRCASSAASSGERGAL